MEQAFCGETVEKGLWSMMLAAALLLYILSAEKPELSTRRPFVIF